MTTNDPAIVLASLRVIDAIIRDDHAELMASLETAKTLGPFEVMLSIAAFAAETVQQLPDWRASLDEFMLAADINTPPEETPDVVDP